MKFTRSLLPGLLVALSAAALGLFQVSCTKALSPQQASKPALSKTTDNQAATSFTWKGYTWYIKAGSGIGPGPNTWGANNAYVDSNGYLHLKITNDSGVWNCAEIYTDPVTLGFGTYQWQVDGRVDAFDPSVVLGFFPYGPTVGIGADGTNEIDIEFSKWNNAAGNNGWWTVYPYSGSGSGQKSFKFTLTDTLTTNRFTWTNTGVNYWMMSGLQPISSTANLINSWSYAPADYATKVPQQAMPLRMNLWLFRGTAPASGSNVEVIIRDFQFVPQGSTTTYTIAASAGTGGTISPNGNVTVNQGASQTFTITPNSGYSISAVTVDGASVGAVTSYTFSNVQAAHTISATFTQTPVTKFTITASCRCQRGYSAL